MKISKYFVTIATFAFIGLISYGIINPKKSGSYDNWFLLMGLLNILAFILLMVYNPVYNDIAQPKHELDGFFVVENADKDLVELRDKTGDSFNDNMGYGINLPNIIGLGFGIISLLIGIIM